MNKIKTMLTLQQELNDNTNGKGWESGLSKNNKIIDWRRCIYLEAAEFIESYPWKHWKNIDAKPDYENIKIEAVDIWHFVMSEALRVYAIERKGSIEELASAISSQRAFEEFKTGKKAKLESHYDEIALVEEFVKSLFCDEPIESLVAKFFTVASVAGLDLDELYQLYIGKNILNAFRQDHGYKDGSYIKIWGDVEDNVVMQEILADNKDITPKELYDKLELSYNQL